MEPKTAASLHRRRSAHLMNAISLGSAITGTITIGTDGSLSGSSSTSGWQADGDVITFGSRLDAQFYSLTLQPPLGWSWNPSSSLQIFQDDGDGNSCGFFSNHATIAAFNTDNQAVQVLPMILNLVNESSVPQTFTVFLLFPTATSSTTPSGSFSPQVFTEPFEGVVLGEVHNAENNPDAVGHIEWESVAAGFSASEQEEGEISIKPLSLLEVEVKAWHVNLEVAGDGWELGSSPAFQVSVPSNPQCGLVFPGSGLKVYNHLHSDHSAQTFILGLRLVKGTLSQWVDDPTVVFEPPDPPTLTLQS